jgi:hypothetical protein
VVVADAQFLSCFRHCLVHHCALRFVRLRVEIAPEHVVAERVAHKAAFACRHDLLKLDHAVQPAERAAQPGHYVSGVLPEHGGHDLRCE